MRPPRKVRKHRPFRARPLAQHLRLPLLPARPPLNLDHVVDLEVPRAIPRDPFAIRLQRTRLTLPLRRAFLHDLEDAPLHHLNPALSRVVDHLRHESPRLVKRRDRLEVARDELLRVTLSPSPL